MAKSKIKKKLSNAQEFEIMKLVIDKLLWIGFIVSLFGMYEWYTKTWQEALFPIVLGSVILIIFVTLIITEYEFIR